LFSYIILYKSSATAVRNSE